MLTFEVKIMELERTIKWKNEENKKQKEKNRKARKETRIKFKCFQTRMVKENLHLELKQFMHISTNCSIYENNIRLL